MTFFRATLGTTTSSVMTLNIKGLFVTLSVTDIHYENTQIECQCFVCHYADCHYSECCCAECRNACKFSHFFSPDKLKIFPVKKLFHLICEIWAQCYKTFSVSNLQIFVLSSFVRLDRKSLQITITLAY